MNHYRNAFVSSAAAGAFLLAPQPSFAAEDPVEPAPTIMADKGYDVSPDLQIPQEDTLFMPITVDVTNANVPAILRPYAPEFDDTQQVTPEDISGVQAWLGSLAGRGLRNTEIIVQGSASAEDNQYEPNAGVDTPSQNNIDLANDRAAHVADTIRTEIADHKDLRIFGEDRAIPVKVLPGTEQQLSKADVADLQDFAQSHGYTTIRDMVVTYNRGNANNTVEHHLDELLGEARAVKVIVKGEIPIPPTLIEKAEPVKPAPEEKIVIDDEKLLGDTFTTLAALGALGVGAAGLAGVAVSMRYRRRSDGTWVEEPIDTDNHPYSKPDFDTAA